MPSVLLSRMIEGGLNYGLGSTLAVRREALDKIGGFSALVDHLADDYELGARVAKAGYRVALSADVVETSVPAYDWQGFVDHQLRWFRTVRDARPWGYAGLVFTHGLAWAMLNLVASGLSPVSVWLLVLSFFLRLTLAMTVGRRSIGRPRGAAEPVAAAVARCCGHGTVGRRLCRQYHRVARRALHGERRTVAQGGLIDDLVADVALRRNAGSSCLADGLASSTGTLQQIHVLVLSEPVCV